MGNSSDKKQFIEKLLQIKYEKKGYLLEDDIIDICIEYDLDLVEIDSLCDKLLHQKMIVKDAETEKNINDTESYVDRSHLDYDALLGRIKMEYPNCAVIIDMIADILPPQSKEWQTIIVAEKNGNGYAKDQMVKMYLRTVMKQAYYFSKDNYCDFEEAVGLVMGKTMVYSGLTYEEVYKYILPYVSIPEELEAKDDISNMIQDTVKELIERVLKPLSDRERLVLRLRYGLADKQERTLEDVGNILHVTRERVRQIEAKALRKINASKKASVLRDYL